MTDMKLDDAPDGAAAGGAAPPTIQIYTTYKNKTDHTVRIYPNTKQHFAEWPPLVNGHQLLIGCDSGIVLTENQECVGAYNNQTCVIDFNQNQGVANMLFPEHVQMGQNVTPPPTGSGPLTGFGPPTPATEPPMARGEIVPYNKVEEQTLGKMNAKNQKNTVKAGHKIRDIEIKMQEAAVVQKKAAEIFQVTLVSNPCLYRLC